MLDKFQKNKSLIKMEHSIYHNNDIHSQGENLHSQDQNSHTERENSTPCKRINLSLQCELFKRKVNSTVYTNSLLCLNELHRIYQYSKNNATKLIIDWLDEEFKPIDINIDNIPLITMYISVSFNKIPKSYIDEVIESINSNLFFDCSEDKFLGIWKSKILSHNIDIEELKTITQFYCQNDNDSNIIAILNFFNNILQIGNIESSMNDFIDYIARCNVYNDRPLYEDLLEYINDMDVICVKVFFYDEMMKLKSLFNSFIENHDWFNIHNIMSHNFYKNIQFSCECRYMQHRKKYESEHVKSVIKSFNVKIHQMKHKNVALGGKILHIKKMIGDLITDQNTELFESINNSILDILISLEDIF